MSPVWSRIAWSTLGLVIYAPIPVLIAFPTLAPDALGARFNGIPLGVCLVGGVIVALILLTWICGLGERNSDRAALRSGAGS